MPCNLIVAVAAALFATSATLPVLLLTRSFLSPSRSFVEFSKRSFLIFAGDLDSALIKRNQIIKIFVGGLTFLAASALLRGVVCR